MAKMDFDVDKVILPLNSLKKNMDSVCNEMLLSGGKILKESTTRALNDYIGNSVLTKPRSTGGLLKSIALSKPRMIKKMRKIDVQFRGYAPLTPRRHKRKIPGKGEKQRYGQIAFVHEYGKKGQDPRPAVQEAMEKSEKEINAEMNRVYEKNLKMMNLI